MVTHEFEFSKGTAAVEGKAYYQQTEQQTHEYPGAGVWKWSAYPEILEAWDNDGNDLELTLDDKVEIMDYVLSEPYNWE